MAKNDYLSKQKAMQQGFLDVGEQFGIQKVWDYLQITLRDPAVMGKDTFGRKRLEKIYKNLNRLVDEYHTAFTSDKEADYKQEQLDAQLREIWGEDLVPFYKRYPELKKIDYGKSKKGWK
jgi:hypothetical protein